MADLLIKSQDVTLIDESNGNKNSINANGELLVAGSFGNSTISLKKYVPRFWKSVGHIPVSENDGDVLVHSHTGVGKLDFISLTLTDDEGVFILEVDGVEIFRESIEKLDNDDEYNLRAGAKKSKNIPPSNGVWTFGDNHIIISWSEPVDFLTGWSIKVASKGGDFETEHCLVQYREEI